ncbi:MAG: hypothetical protein ABSH50_09865 [Bryobacteraceae bacterium]
MQSFETGLLAQEENLAGPAAINRELIAKAETIESPQRIVLDMDSTEIPVYGQPYGVDLDGGQIKIPAKKGGDGKVCSGSPEPRPFLGFGLMRTVRDGASADPAGEQY